MIKKGELVLLLGKDHYLTEAGNIFNCKYGAIDLRKVKYGSKIKSNKNEKFLIVKPSMVDILFNLKRGPQVILPKDAAAVVGVTGCESGWNVVDAGSGSGWMSIFIGNIIKPGKLVTYEKNKAFCKLASHNIRKTRLKNIIIKNKDITNGIKEKNLDMITLDLENSENMVKHAYKSLKPGGWVVFYVLHTEGIQNVCKELKKYSFTKPRIIENMHITWQFESGERTYTRPRSHLSHTGFLVFARKI